MIHSKKVVAILIFTFLLASCRDSKEKTNPYVHHVGNSKLEIIIENNSKYLIYDSPINAMFIWKDFDPKKGAVAGAGIKINNIKNDTMFTEITVPSSHVKNDTLEINMMYQLRGEKDFKKFYVPVKQHE